ncbi:tetratricopeptide repeat protein [Sphingomonas piscis]|uniref:Tetratricopeptide repeat protein n=1 Tax=Sphingomonas piscis TaxID=2714943 RepID=A0A6G7YMW7_9SPHN|nr:tetratricopeptide repeat protein [Sphingomonas piscis]QIK78082.1 tetratricopeptide repeat protein [Sphingomonas piscis]
MEASRTPVSDLVAKAKAAASAGDWSAAVEALEPAVEAQPQEGEFRLKLAQAYERLGRPDDVVKVLSGPAVAEFPQPKRMLASAYMAMKDYAAALPVLQLLLAADPNDHKLAQWKERCEQKLSSRKIVAGVQAAKALASAERFEEAEQAYLDLLAEFPDLVEARGRLASLYMLQKRWGDAVPHLQVGLALDPSSTELKTTLARALFKLSKAAEALAVLTSLGDAELDRDLLFLQLRCHFELGQWQAAEQAASRLLARLDSADPLSAEAASLRDDALAGQELEHADYLINAGDIARAIARFHDIVGKYPASAPAWRKLATTLLGAERFAEAKDALQRYLQLRPDDGEARRALTRIVVDNSDEKAVLDYIQGTIATGSADIDGYRWLGRYHADRGEWEDSLSTYRQALALEPQSPSARLGVGRALEGLGRRAAALEELHILISSGAKVVEALQLKGQLLVELGRLDQGIEQFERALLEAPKHPLISCKLANALLLKGDVEGFHRLNDRRLELPSFVEREVVPPFEWWTGQLAIEGKLLVWAENGLTAGENIMHMANLRHLTGLGLGIMLEVPPEMVSLVRRSLDGITVVAAGSGPPQGISHHLPLGSLSKWFKPDLASFDTMAPYVAPDPGAVAAQRARLQAQAGEGQILVGLAGPAEDNNASLLMRRIAAPGLSLVELERGEPDTGKVGATDLDDLAALIAAMDLVVCGEGLIAHLAGSMGVPTFVLLPATPRPYWLAKGRNCIWYPNTTLIRRSHIDENWAAAFEAAGSEVTDWATAYDGSKWLVPSAEVKPAITLREKCDAVRAYVIQGRAAFSAYESAFELLQQIPSPERPPELNMLLGSLLDRFGRWDEARSHFESLRADQQFDAQLEERILSVSLAMYDLDYALPIARRLAEGDAACHVVAANILYRVGQKQSALDELRAASLRQVQSDQLAVLAGTILIEMGRVEQAEQYLREQAAVFENPDLYTLLGRTISAQSRYDEALASFDQALVRSPNDPAANFWRTQELIGSGAGNPASLPPLLGELPDASPEDHVVFFAADSGYFFQHGLVLIASLATKSPGAKCHVHLINPDEAVAPAIDLLRSIYPGLEISLSFEHRDFTGLSVDYVRTYYASVRFVRLAEVFARSPASYLSLDADCIVRGNVAAVASDSDNADVTVRMRFDERPHAGVAAGALTLRPTEGARRFIDRSAELIRSTLETGEAVWFLDQVVLNHAVRELGGDEVQLAQMDMSYIDWFFRQDSLVWTGKGPRKFQHERYTSEVALYQELLEGAGLAELKQDSERRHSPDPEPATKP